MNDDMKRGAYLTSAGVREVLLRAGFEESVNAGDEGFRVYSDPYVHGVIVAYMPCGSVNRFLAMPMEARRLDDYARVLKGLGFSVSGGDTAYGYGLTVGGNR